MLLKIIGPGEETVPRPRLKSKRGDLHPITLIWYSMVRVSTAGAANEAQINHEAVKESHCGFSNGCFVFNKWGTPANPQFYPHLLINGRAWMLLVPRQPSLKM
jgi:hypothetical protein